MKKIICVLLLVALMATLFVGCGAATFTCDLCGEEKSGTKYEENVFGETLTYCKDCKEGLEELAGLFG